MYVKYDDKHKIVKIIEDKDIYHYESDNILSIIKFDITKWELLKLVIKYILKGL